MQTIPITNNKEQLALKIIEKLDIRDVGEFKLVMTTVSMLMDMFEDDEEIEMKIERIQDITERDPEDFGCSTCDQVNEICKE